MTERNRKEHYEKLAESYQNLATDSHNFAAANRGRGDVSSFEKSAVELGLQALECREKARIEGFREDLMRQ